MTIGTIVCVSWLLQQARVEGVCVVWKATAHDHIRLMSADLLHFKPINILLQMSNVLVTALLDGTPMLVDEILITTMGLLKSHPCVVGQLRSNLLQLLLGDIVNFLTSGEGVLRKLLQQLLCFARTALAGKVHKGRE
jgi:hypothetical protein